MVLGRVSAKTARILALVFMITTAALAASLAGSWIFVSRLALNPIPEPVFPARLRPSTEPVSPLQVHYQLDLPGRGEIFPALAGSQAADYWPVVVLNIANLSGRPVLQIVSAGIPGWSVDWRETVVIGPHETRSFNIAPEMLPLAYRNNEIRQATLSIEVQDSATGRTFAQQRPVFLHSASDLYWGRKFANAQWLARWVTPHDEAVLQLVSRAEHLMPGGRLRGYNPPAHGTVEDQVRRQAQAVFQAMQRSHISYVSSIYTFGNYPDEAQRIRLPRETLSLRNANCIDVSVAFASAIENLDMQPVIVIVPGHAFTGVRLGPGSQRILYLDLTVLPTGSFNAAAARAQQWLKKIDTKDILVVDIGAARSLGIYPLPLPGMGKPAVNKTL